MKVVKVRIIGSKKACERILGLITSQLPAAAIEGEPRKVERDPEKDPYNSTFGKAEAIGSFNLILALSQERGGLESYYDSEKGALEHYKYPEQFLRTTKNAFISLVPEELLDEIAGYEPVTYEMVRKRLERRGMRIRIDELRDHWGTFMLDHGLKREEVDLLQGRVGKSIFVKHYWSPAMMELRDRVFRVLEILEGKL